MESPKSLKAAIRRLADQKDVKFRRFSLTENVCQYIRDGKYYEIKFKTLEETLEFLESYDKE